MDACSLAPVLSCPVLSSRLVSSRLVTFEFSFVRTPLVKMVSSSPEAGKFFHLSCCKWDQASSGIGIGYDHGASGNGGDAVLGGGEQNIPAGHWKNHWICDAAAIATRRRRRRKRRNGKSVASPVELACFAASKQSTRPRSLRYLRVRVEQEKVSIDWGQKRRHESACAKGSCCNTERDEEAATRHNPNAL